MCCAFVLTVISALRRAREQELGYISQALLEQAREKIEKAKRKKDKQMTSIDW